MKRSQSISVVVAILMCLAVPCTAGMIEGVGIVTSGPYGDWRTGVMAAIGISDPGGLSNPFHNDLTTGAILSPGIASGTYLAFLGYEDYWPTTPSTTMTATLTLYYTGGATRSATFQVGDIHASGGWLLLSGDPLLSLGGGGFTETPNRVDTSGSTGITANLGVPDVVLKFSDVACVPEPATVFLAGTAILALGLMRRKFRA